MEIISEELRLLREKRAKFQDGVYIEAKEYMNGVARLFWGAEVGVFLMTLIYHDERGRALTVFTILLFSLYKIVEKKVYKSAFSKVESLYPHRQSYPNSSIYKGKP